MSETPLEVESAPPAGGGVDATPEVEENENEFETRVSRILSMIEDDPKVRDRVLVELYVTVAEFKAQLDLMQAEFENLGPKAIFQMMRGK